MAKKQEKLQATELGKKMIEEGRNELGWSQGDDSPAIQAASSWKIEKALATKELNVKEGIPLADFEAIMYEPLIFGPSSICQNSLRRFVRELKTQKIKIISYEKFNDLIEKYEVKADGISYKTWQNFYQGKPVNKPAFIAYCEGMGLLWQTICGYNQNQLLELALSRLNHSQQRNNFSSFSRKPSPLALYIQDSLVNRISLRWLLKSLLSASNPDNIEAKIIRFELLYGGQAKYGIKSLWSKMRYEFCPTVQKIKPQLIASKVIEHLENQHIILIFDGVEKMDKDYMNQLLKEFWEPLVEASKVKTLLNHSLLMYWIDCNTNENQWVDKFPFAQTYDQNWQPTIPIKHNDICFVDQFSASDVKKWLNNKDVQQLLNSDFEQIKSKLDRVCQASEQISPEILLKKIYGACQDLKWIHYEYIWQNL